MASDLFGRPLASKRQEFKASTSTSEGRKRLTSEIKARVEQGDCLEVLRRFADEGLQVSAVATDPPYHLSSIVSRFGKTSVEDNTRTSGRARNRTDTFARISTGFMGQTWDGGDIAFKPELWRAVIDVLLPGGYLVAFGGTRTYHRMACAVEDAGFEIRDQLAWMYGTGFPKSHDISKLIDAHLGAKRKKVKVTGARNQKTTGSGRDGTKGATRPFIEKALKTGYVEMDGLDPMYRLSV